MSFSVFRNKQLSKRVKLTEEDVSNLRRIKTAQVRARVLNKFNNRRMFFSTRLTPQEKKELLALRSDNLEEFERKRQEQQVGFDKNLKKRKQFK